MGLPGFNPGPESFVKLRDCSGLKSASAQKLRLKRQRVAEVRHGREARKSRSGAADQSTLSNSSLAAWASSWRAILWQA